MAKKGVHKKRGRSPGAEVALAEPAPAPTVIEAQLDVAGAVALHADLLQAIAAGALVIDMSEGQPTQPAIQLLVAARNSARAGHDVSFADRATAVLNNVIEEDV